MIYKRGQVVNVCLKQIAVHIFVQTSQDDYDITVSIISSYGKKVSTGERSKKEVEDEKNMYSKSTLVLLKCIIFIRILIV